MFVAGVLTSILMIAGLVSPVFLAFRRGLDPDNLIGPTVTTLGDIFGVTFLYIALLFVGGWA
jgi:mgtE-like transporter